MTIPSSLLPEFDQEMKSTRRVLERVPSEKAEWRPHPKSFPIGHLAQLLAGMPGWITNAVRETRLDLSKGAGYSFEKTETLLDQFDKNVQGAREARWANHPAPTHPPAPTFALCRRTSASAASRRARGAK